MGNMDTRRDIGTKKSIMIMGRKRIAFALLICLFGMLFGTKEAKAAPSGAGTYQVTASKGVNVRSGASTGYSKVTALGNGAKIEVTQVDGDWGYIPACGGWVNLNYAALLQSASSNRNLTASSDLPDGYYIIKSKSDPSKVLDVEGAWTWNGATVLLWEQNNGDNQTFYFERQADGSYKIIAKHSGLSVEVRNSSHENEADIAQWEYADGYACKLWYVIRDGSYYKLVNKESGLCMDIQGNNMENGTNIWQYEDNGTDAQRFQLVSAEGAASQTAVVRASSGLRMRQGRGTQYAKLATIPNGTRIEVRNIQSGWGEVTYNGKTGYISMDYVALDTGSSAGTAVSLNVPDMKQYDSRWKNEEVGKSGKTIGAIGCAITSLAMAESYRTNTTITPSAMKNKLSFTSGGLLYWPSNYRKYDGADYLGKLRELLNAGKPVLVCGFTPSGGQHWIVVTGYQGGGASASDFSIHDPNSSARTTLQDFFNKYSRYSCLRYYD